MFPSRSTLVVLVSVLSVVHAQLQQPPQNPICVTGLTTSAVNNKQSQKNCPAFGEPPAQIYTCAESPNGCQNLNPQGCPGTELTWSDPNGTPRQACYVQNTNASPSNQLPLIVWLHPSLATGNNSFPLTGWAPVLNATENIGGKGTGFSYLLVEGRNTHHYYPSPDDRGVGWDNWYRDLSKNVDALTIDHFVQQVNSTGVVDPRHIHLSGWSNGAAMAIMYGLDRKYYASAAVYSAPDPYRDAQCSELCPQKPQPLYYTPFLDVHNYCDIIGICTTGLYLYSDLRNRYPQVDQHFTVIEDATQLVVGQDGTATCAAECQSRCGETPGALAHLRWPALQNELFFSFMRAHPLPAGGQTANPNSGTYPLGVSPEPYSAANVFQCLPI